MHSSNGLLRHVVSLDIVGHRDFLPYWLLSDSRTPHTPLRLLIRLWHADTVEPLKEPIEGTKVLQIIGRYPIGIEVHHIVSNHTYSI